MLSDHCLASLDGIPTPRGLIPGCLPSSMRGGRERPAALIVARPIGYSRLQRVSTELLKGVPHYSVLPAAREPLVPVGLNAHWIVGFDRVNRFHSFR